MLAKKSSKKTSKRKISKRVSKKVSKQVSKQVSKRVSKKTPKRKTSKKTSKKENGEQEIFFMGIFDNIIKCNNKEILIIYDKEGEIWFGLRTILQILNYTSIDKTIHNVIINKNNMKKYQEIKKDMQN